jgi:NAD(P)H-dependent FMN reductase
MRRKVLVFAGSARTESLHRKLAQAIFREMRERGVDATFAELRDYPMPIYDGDVESEGTPAGARSFAQLVRDHDAFVIASPEYNGSFTPLLKNALDWASRPSPGESHLAAFRGKTAVIASLSPGANGGRRGLRHLRELLQMMHVTVVPEEIAIGRASNAFDQSGHLTRAEDRRQVEAAVDSLAAAMAADEVAYA